MKQRKSMWRAWLVSCCLLLCIGIVQPALAEIEGGLRVLHEYDTRILLNGTYLTAEVLAEISDDRVAMLPLRAILEGAGYTVDWDARSNRAIVYLHDGEEYLLDLTNGRAYLSGAEVGTFPYEVKRDRTLTTPAFFSLVDGMEARFDVATHTAIVSATPARPNDVVFYDLGAKQITLPSGGELRAKLNGAIAVPSSRHNPVVIVLHGSHPIESATDNRYDLGFSYLLKALASEGFVAVGLNVNLQYSLLDGEPIGQERLIAIVEETLAALKLANAGTRDGFGADLTDKLDLSNLVLIGHSRGGGGVVYLADHLQRDIDVRVVGLALIAPTDAYVQDLASTDIPTTFIIPELDGDVLGLDGYTYFDTLVNHPSRVNDLQLVYLYGANHNAFNEGVVPQDLGKIWYAGDRTTIPATTQRRFTADYLSAFADAVISGTPIHTIASSLNGELFGLRAMVSNYLAKSAQIYAAQDETVTSNGATLEQVISSVQMNRNTAGLFSPGGFSQELALAKISWEARGATVAFATSEATQDLSSMRSVGLYLAPDSTSSLNNKQDQSFRVELVDAFGEVASYLLDRSTPVLAYQDGHPIFDGEAFSTITPLGIVGVPLAAFEQVSSVDLTRIAEIRLSFTESASGCIMVRSIFVSP